jgi:hypothetical protein
MAEQNASPWRMTCHPSEVAACTTSTRFSITRGTWADPDLADLLAPPVTVTASNSGKPTATVRQPGRRRASLGPFDPPGRLAAELPTWRDLVGALGPV